MAKKKRSGRENNLSTNQADKLDENSFMENYKWWVSGVALILVVVVAWGLYGIQKDKNNVRMSNQVYEKGEDVIKQFEAKKLDAKDLSREVMSILDEMGGFIGSAPLVLKSSDLLIAKNHLAEAEKILRKAINGYGSENLFIKYFLVTRLATVYEDQKRYKEAIKELETLLNPTTSLMPGKVYLDLGRLYKRIGDKKRAKGSFQHIVDSNMDKDLVRLAEIYLDELS